MKAGFTGSRKGMTLQQKAKVKELFKSIDISELHHGDCIGADEEIHGMFIWKKVGHPPTVRGLRAFKLFDEWRPEKPYLERNRNIVDETEILIATPNGTEKECGRSGTWSTIRYAKKQQKKIYIILPTGEVI